MYIIVYFDGDEWVINGIKMWISNGGIVEVIVVFVIIDKQGGYCVIVVFVVFKDVFGFLYNKIKYKMGQCVLLISELVFENVCVFKENQFGGLGDGFKIVMKMFDKIWILVVVGLVGFVWCVLEESVKYVKQCEVFGMFILQFQVIQFKLVDMVIGVEMGCLMYQKVVWLVDQGYIYGVESVIVKVYCLEMVFNVVNEVIQIYGGYGYVGEYLVEKLLCDVKFNMIYEGISEIQCVVISCGLLK